MDPDQLFPLIGLAALLMYLLPAALRLPPQRARALHLVAIVLLGGGIVVALVLFLLGVAR